MRCKPGSQRSNDLRLTDLDNSLEGGLLNSSKEVAHTCPKIDTCVTISLEVLHLLVNPLVSGNVHLEVIILVLPLVLEGP